MNKHINKIIVGIMLVILLIFWLILAPTSKAEEQAYDAHFYVRYDLSVQDENGNTHYDAHKYFPVGDIVEDYNREDNQTDYTSADGKVKTNSAFVPDAVSVIDNGEVNVYHQFGATKDTIKNHFKNVYDNIITEPSKDTMTAAINRALGSEMATAYQNGKIDVLWYVIKQEKYIHVDGVLYWVDTGEAVEEPEEFPTENEEKEIKETNSPIESQPTDRTETVQSAEKYNHSPQTGDTIPVMTLVVVVVIGGFMAAYIIRKKF